MILKLQKGKIIKQLVKYTAPKATEVSSAAKESLGMATESNLEKVPKLSSIFHYKLNPDLEALKNKVNIELITKALASGQLKFGIPTTYIGIHQSNTPLIIPQFPYASRWDAAERGADPDGFWITLSQEPNTTGLMASRPFASRWQVNSQKPLIQVGELPSYFSGKNNLRNAIVQYGKQQGADAFEFQNIADNRLANTSVLMTTNRARPQYIGGVAEINYAGPTTGKSTYVRNNQNSNIVDLDSIGEYKALREQVAKQLGLDFRDPKVTDSPEYQQAFNEFLTRWSQDMVNKGKRLFGSSKAMLRSGLPMANEPFIPDFETFLARNQARGFRETPEQAKAWYDSIISSYPKIKIDNRFISEIESMPTDDASNIIPLSKRDNFTNPDIRYSLGTTDGFKLPTELIPSLQIGKRAASTFFDHPVVKTSYANNQQLARALGIKLQDRPENISEIVGRPVKMKFIPYQDNEIAQVAQSGLGDPNAEIGVAWTPMSENDAKSAMLHEGLHLGYYGAPIRTTPMTKEVYDNEYAPAQRYWTWKISKLIRPEYMDGYLGDVQSGEAGVNLIEIGKNLGLKLGSKYPGDEEFYKLLERWPEHKKFLIPHLNTDTKAGRRHIWDAMTGQYFGLGLGLGTGLTLTSIPQNKNGGIIKAQGGISKLLRSIFKSSSKKLTPVVKKTLPNNVSVIKSSYISPSVQEIPIPGVFVKPGVSDSNYLEDMESIKNAINNYGYIPEEIEPAVKFMENAFDSQWYKQRHTNVYGSNLGLDNTFWKEHLSEALSKLRDPRNVYVKVNNLWNYHGSHPIRGVAFDSVMHPGEEGVLDLTDNPIISRRFIFYKKDLNLEKLKNIMEHELTHVTFNKEKYPRIGYEDIKVVPELQGTNFESYLTSPDELRARGIPTAHHMYLEGYDPNSEIDWLDYYLDEKPKLPNQKDIYHFDPKTLKPFTKMLGLGLLPTVGGVSTTLAIPQNTELKKNGGILKAQNAARTIPKVIKAIYKTPTVKKLVIPQVPRLDQSLRINSDLTSLQDKVFKEAVLKYGDPVSGSIGESPIGGTKLLSAMMNGTYVEPPANTYGGLRLNPNYYYRRGWGIIDDALDKGIIRVPEGDYIGEALQKYPWLDNGNPFNTTLMGQKFPYFAEGNFWPAGGKLGVEPTDLIAIPKGLPWAKWVAGSKWGALLPDRKPSEFGGRATPLIDGKTNLFPTKYSLLYRLNPETKEYIKFKKGGILKGQGGTKIISTLAKSLKAPKVSQLDHLPIWKRIVPIMKTTRGDLEAMNKYHVLNVNEYNKIFGTNIQSIPFRTDFGLAPVKLMPDNEFIIRVKEGKFNAPTNDLLQIGGFYDSINDQVVLPYKAKSSAAYHEFLHQGKYGITNPEITKWRISQLVNTDKISELTDNQKNYFLSETEAPVHLRQLGENMGIKVGDPYPGDEAFDALIETNGIGGSTYYMKRDTSDEKKLLWKAMNGTLFGLPIIATSSGLITASKISK